MEAVASNLEVKLTQLRMNLEKTDSVIEGNNLETIERHKDTLKNISAKVNSMRLEVEAIKLAAGEDLTGIGAWNASVDEKLQQADKEIGKVREWFGGKKKRNGS